MVTMVTLRMVLIQLHPFEKFVSATGTSTYSAYSAFTEVNCGFKPIIVSAYCQSGGGYLITWFYYDGVCINARRSGGTTITSDGGKIEVTDTGFKWQSIDSSWGAQTITWFAAGVK